MSALSSQQCDITTSDHKDDIIGSEEGVEGEETDKVCESDGAAEVQQMTMVDEGEVAPDGLWLTRARFGTTITPKGPSCIQVHHGFIFVVRYQGGMADRSMWLSRKRIGSGEWNHIGFPHRHVMFQGDNELPEEQQRGDAHNNIALGICPKDATIHLLYDMHAYQPKDHPANFFNYSCSKQGAAEAPDSEWAIELFLPRQTFLSKDCPKRLYTRVTYPAFLITDAGDLISHWRVGGSASGVMHFSKYDGHSWSPPVPWNTKEGAVGFYGGFGLFNGRMTACWQRRCAADAELGYKINRGLYVAHCATDGVGAWFTVAGAPLAFPLDDLEAAKVFEPTAPGQKSEFVSFVVAPSGAWHALLKVDGAIQHFFCGKNTGEVQAEGGALVQSQRMAVGGGQLHTHAGRVYLVGLQQKRPVVLSTAAGTHEWKEEIRLTKGRQYSHGVSLMVERDAMYYYLMQACPAHQDARPIFVLRFLLSS